MMWSSILDSGIYSGNERWRYTSNERQIAACATLDMQIVCKDLSLSVTQEGDHVEVHLEDQLAMTEANVSVELGITSMASREYHLREAIILAVRQVIGQAFDMGMMQVDIRKLPTAPPRYQIVKELPSPLEEDIY
jgi:hypothetical protein